MKRLLSLFIWRYRTTGMTSKLALNIQTHTHTPTNKQTAYKNYYTATLTIVELLDALHRQRNISNFAEHI